jgi:iron(III) transport system ATP-binding protein
VYERPRTSFVARFIGASNILDGEIRGAQATVGGVTLQLATPGPATARPGALSIRPHAIGLGPAGERRAGPGELNVVTGVVRRHIYLGDSRDYLIAVDGGGLTLRAIVPPSARYVVGDHVALAIPASACHVLAG